MAVRPLEDIAIADLLNRTLVYQHLFPHGYMLHHTAPKMPALEIVPETAQIIQDYGRLYVVKCLVQ